MTWVDRSRDVTDGLQIVWRAVEKSSLSEDSSLQKFLMSLQIIFNWAYGGIHGARNRVLNLQPVCEGCFSTWLYAKFLKMGTLILGKDHSPSVFWAPTCFSKFVKNAKPWPLFTGVISRGHVYRKQPPQRMLCPPLGRRAGLPSSGCKNDGFPKLGVFQLYRMPDVCVASGVIVCVTCLRGQERPA